MRRLCTLAVALIAFAGSQSGETTAAPVPKAPVPPSIDGKYTLLATSTNTGLVGKAKIDRGDIDTTGAWAGGPSRLVQTNISKSEIVIEGRTVSALPTTMEYTLDPTKSPIAIDVEMVPVRGKKSKALGVAEITGNRLVIALAREGAERPKTVDEAEGVTVYYFQKAPPPPRTEFRIVALAVGKEAEAEKELNALAKEGYELVTTTSPTAVNDKAAVTTVHFILKRTVKQP